MFIFNCAGRAGELSKTTWQNLTFDRHFRCLVLDWSQPKTAKVKSMHVFPARAGFATDPFHALFCYLILSATNGQSDFIWEELASVKSSSEKVNNIFGEFYSHTDANGATVTQKLTSRV